jgi:UDP-N-acetylmuramyl tripeptide synthase
LPFEDSRRLTGSNVFFVETGVVLDVIEAPQGDAWLAAWRERVERAAAELGWPGLKSAVRRHTGGVLLAITAPADQLFLATEVNEWAVCATLAELEPAKRSLFERALVEAAPDAKPAPVIAQGAALARFRHLQSSETNPSLRALLHAAAARALPYTFDDAELTLGSGAGSCSFPLAALPDMPSVPWQALSSMPTALVTGSNGKTTTVRLLAACARAHGWRACYNCTDGVFLDDDALARGDYSGPAGARLVLREKRAQAGILETARGGILRRGIAVSHADTAVVTNISADHFGEYGIDDLAGLADVKLSVAAALEPSGLLVLNADDAVLPPRANELSKRFGRAPRLAWFALDDEHALLRMLRSEGGWTCGVHAGHLRLSCGGPSHDLGSVRSMPLSVGGFASYNVANLAAAALAASALGIAASTIADVFGRFGSTPHDNVGRMMSFDAGGVRVLIDYAHNPDGLRGFLRVAQSVRGGTGRLGLLLGHAGNRKDVDIEALAKVAAEFHPDLIVVKENETQLRGRAPGEVPGLLRRELLRLGLSESVLPVCGSELEAARYALEWARSGDVLALPLHGSGARDAVVALLESHS